ALEKRPEDRYGTGAALVEDFTIAAGMEPVGVSASAEYQRVEPQSSPPLADDADEETLVRRRVTRPMAPPLPPPATSAAPPSMVVPLPGEAPAAQYGFNPWKILIPSLIGLLVLFGVIYAFTRNTQPTEANTGAPLAADPNSSPVEP